MRRKCGGCDSDNGSTNVYNLNLDWKFYKPAEPIWPLAKAVDDTRDALGNVFYEIEYDDVWWRDVSLPHTFNDIDSFDDVANDAGEENLYRGVTFYRKTFTLPASDQGSKVFIEFEGIRQAAYVYLNEKMVGYYEAGVAPFGFDLTKHIEFGSQNVLAIATDNTSARGMDNGTYIRETIPGTPPGSNMGNAFQWNTKDFNPIMGGLSRNVKLYVKNPVYITLPLYSNLKSKGVYIYPTAIDVADKSAVINIEAEIRNESSNDHNLSLEAVIIDHKGNVVERIQSAAKVVEIAEDVDEELLSVVAVDAYDESPQSTDTVSRCSTVIKAEKTVNNLRFWSPDDPYLYNVQILLKEEEQVIDVEQITTGFRKLEVKSGKDGGIFINEQFYWLTGYAQRATNEWAVIGIAPDWLRDYDAQLIKDSNANFIRWMHIAAQPVDIRAGDKFGIVAVQPAGDKESESQSRQWAQRVEVMRDIIIYFRNSPSVMFWEAGNTAISAKHMREMVALRKTLDPCGRPMGCRSLEKEDALDEAEWVGTMLGRRVRDRQGYTKKGEFIRDKSVLIETEYTRDESPRRVWDDFSPPDFDYVNVFTGANGAKENYKDAWDLTVEDFLVRHTEAYYEFYSRRVQANVKNPYYSAAAAMIWSDSNQHGRLQATENCRMSGRVDAVRIKKQSFHAFKVMQSPKPDILVVGHWNYPTDSQAYLYQVKDPLTHRYTGEVARRDATNKTIYVIGSPHVNKVELIINGKSYGFSGRTKNAFLYAFSGINIMQPGYIEAVGYDVEGKEITRHKIETVGIPVRIKLTPTVGPEGLRADGSDVAFVDVEVVDAQERVYPLDYERIDFTLSGPGVFLGGYNSGIKDLKHDPNYVYAECGTNRVFIRSTRKPGPITLRASRPGLPTAIITIDAQPFTVEENGLTTKLPQTILPDYDLQFQQKQTIPVVDITDIDMHSFANGSEQIKIFVDQQQIMFAKGLTAYRMVGAYCPAFPVLDALRVNYQWDSKAKRLTVTNGQRIVETVVGDSDMYVDGVPGTINDWPEIINGELHIEISAVVPALGFNAYWGIDGYSYYIDSNQTK